MEHAGRRTCVLLCNRALLICPPQAEQSRYLLRTKHLQTSMYALSIRAKQLESSVANPAAAGPGSLAG
jgi:hypothetical protein